MVLRIIISRLRPLYFHVSKTCYTKFMLAKVLSGATVGLDSVLVAVEVDISERSLPSFIRGRNAIPKFELYGFLSK